MHALPEAREFVAFLARARRRARVLSIARGAAIGFAAAALAAIVKTDLGSRFLDPLAEKPTPEVGFVVLSLVCVAAGIGVSVLVARRGNLAATVERRNPASRNLVLTAAEVLTQATPLAPYIAARVLRDASAFASRLDLRQIFPARATVVGLVLGITAWSAAIIIAASGRAAAVSGAAPSSPSSATVLGIDIEITPPDYSAQPARTLHNPARIDALVNSRIRVTVTADAASVTLDRISGSEPLAAAGRSFTATVLADSDGFLAIAPRAADGTPGQRRLIGLAVTPDQTPRVRVTTPGRDLLLANGQHVLPFTVEATDDLGLASLHLRYTRVAGSGETFTFTDGEVPVDLTRTSDTAWAARGNWSLAPLGLEAGDMLIYRGVATDKRPGAPISESDAFIVEITAPGALPSEGFAIDDRQDKYAISQQMVILNTERLLAKRASMTPDEFLREAQGLAAEQRQVRAEFVFMMGGELADAGLDLTTLNEEAEAAGEDDLAAGRLANRGRADLMRAIRSMSRAAARLAEPDLTAALPVEKEALAFLQRAFSRSRYILRTLSERERIDLSRRLTGVLAALARGARAAAAAPPHPRVADIRRVLVDLATLAADTAGAATARAGRTTSLAERVLRIDPASAALRDVSSALTRAAELIASPSNTSAVQAQFDRAAAGLTAIARADLARDPLREPHAGLDALAGALADALRREGRSR